MRLTSPSWLDSQYLCFIAFALIAVGCRSPHPSQAPPSAQTNDDTRGTPSDSQARIAESQGKLDKQESSAKASSRPPDGANPSHSSGSAAAKKQGQRIVLRGGRVMTATGVIYDRADVLIEDEHIIGVGVDLKIPSGTQIIEVQGKTITPGIIDSHSHMGVYASPSLHAHSDGNEAVSPVTAYAHTADAFWPQDPQLTTARAGGVTTVQVLPGSANLIGGRSITIKLRPNLRSIDDARFPHAPGGLKMACGENPKRVYGRKGGPSTRMGNVAGYRRAFQAAVEYRKRWKNYREKLNDWKKKQEKTTKSQKKRSTTKSKKSDKQRRPDAPKIDHGLENLVMALDGKLLVHNHCYRADEMSIMLNLAKDFGFKIRSFHHAVEGYKIADRLARTGTSASVWADWWGFKAEAYDGILENAALIANAGARAIIHSDSAIGVQRLNQEAAKAMYSGRRAGISISEDTALRWITANPAWALGIHQQTGTLESGKMADIVVWNGSPFSVYAKAEQVYIDGTLVYDRDDPQKQPRTDFDLGFRPGDLEEPRGPKEPEHLEGGLN